MEEEVNQRTVALAIRTAKLTGNVLRQAMRLYLQHHRNRRQTKSMQAAQKHGKLTVKKLMGKDAGAASIEITEKNIKDFEKVAKKYNVDFAVKKDKTLSPPKYIVFFKARDTDVISQAFKEYVKQNERKQERPSLKKRLLEHQKAIAQVIKRARGRQRQKDRGQSL